MKRYSDWWGSNQTLSAFLSLGDAVDEAFRDYFLGVLPPVFWSSTLVQMGEPYDHCGANGAPRFATLQKAGQHWYYTGVRQRGAHVDPALLVTPP